MEVTVHRPIGPLLPMYLDLAFYLQANYPLGYSLKPHTIAINSHIVRRDEVVATLTECLNTPISVAA